MICSRCGSPRVTWRGPITALTHTECADCGAINAQEPDENQLDYEDPFEGGRSPADDD